MKLESMVAAGADRNRAMFHGGFVVVVAASVTLSLALTASHAADSGGSGSAGKSPVVTLEAVPGSSIPRVVLAAKAAERLGIDTGKVGEESVVRKQMVSGLIIPPMDKQPESKPSGGGFGGFGKAGPAPAAQPGAANAPTPQAGGGSGGFARVAAPPTPQAGSVGFGGFGQAVAAPAPQPVAPAAPLPQPVTVPATPVASEVWVLVTLSPGEYERLAKDKPAHLLPLATREGSAKVTTAQPTGMAPSEDPKRSMMSLYYKVPGKDHGLAINNRMRVELQLSGIEEKQKTVPYSAVYYDAKGAAWVYVNTAPLTYERQRITVDRVVGDMALLSDGPAVGTPVVTVGAALLYGTEVFKK